MINLISRGFHLIKGIPKSFLMFYIAILILGSILDAVGLASIYSLFALALDTNVESPTYFGWFLKLFPNENKNSQLSIMAISIAILFGIRALLFIFLSWFGIYFKNHIHLYLTEKILSKYMFNQLHWHASKDQSTLIATVGNYTGHVSQHLILGSLDLISSTFMATLLIGTAIWIRPLETLVALLVLIFLSTIFLFLLKPKLKIWGELLIKANESIWRYTKEALIGIKTIKVFNKEDFFQDRIINSLKEYNRLNLINFVIKSNSKNVLEAILLIGILILASFVFTKGDNIQSLFPSLVLLTGTGIRLLPLIVNALNQIHYIRLSESPLDILEKDLSENSKTPSKNITSRNSFQSIHLNNINFGYNNSSLALENINLSIQSGESIAIVGLSGSGKTTLVDIIMGLLIPDKGTIEIDGVEVDIIPKGLFSYVPQDPFLIYGTLAENLSLVDHNNLQREKIKRALELSALNSKLSDLDHGIDTLLREDGKNFSGGERQRIGIARAIYFDSPVLVLDEPTSSLDTVTEASIIDFLNKIKRKKTVIMIAHRLSSIQYFDRIVLLEKGQLIASDTFNNMYQNNPLFKKMVDLSSINGNEIN